jgi:hypothetical protein
LKNFGHDFISKDLQAKGCPRFKLTFIFRWCMVNKRKV